MEDGNCEQQDARSNVACRLDFNSLNTNMNTNKGFNLYSHSTAAAVILNRDMRFINREPMELGTQYSWRYWLAVRALVSNGDRQGQPDISESEGSPYI